MQTLSDLISRFANEGVVEWIGIRPIRNQPLTVVTEIDVSTAGLLGDHNQTGGKRAVTLIQAEHLPVIAGFLGIDQVNPEILRRNIVVRNINLLGLRQRQFRIGTVILEGSGICAPCSRMEEAFGHGGYAAVRGHGGITAKIIQSGKIATGDHVTPV